MRFFRRTPSITTLLIGRRPSILRKPKGSGVWLANKRGNISLISMFFNNLFK